MVVMRLLRIWAIWAYVVVGVGVWLAILESGVHATLAGVAIGLLTPATPLLHEDGRARLRPAGAARTGTSTPTRCTGCGSCSTSRCRWSSGCRPGSTRSRRTSCCRCSRSPTPGSTSGAACSGEALDSAVALGIVARPGGRQAGRHPARVVRWPCGSGSAGCREDTGWRMLAGLGAVGRHRLHGQPVHRRAVVPGRRSCSPRRPRSASSAARWSPPLLGVAVLLLRRSDATPRRTSPTPPSP